MADDERLRCWAAGVEVRGELDAARDSARNIRDLIRHGFGPGLSTAYDAEAANYRLHVGTVEDGIRGAGACGETPIDLSWIGEFRRHLAAIAKPPTNEFDAGVRAELLQSVIDWLERDTAGIPKPSGTTPHLKRYEELPPRGPPVEEPEGDYEEMMQAREEFAKEGIVPGEYTSYHRAMIGGATPPGASEEVPGERAAREATERAILAGGPHNTYRVTYRTAGRRTEENTGVRDDVLYSRLLYITSHGGRVISVEPEK
ncbi:MAG: hypothetical protein ACREDE_11310 [Thermoplasmata archaeon]